MTDGGTPSPMRIAVVVSRFPKFTETFVVDEIRALESLGWQVELFPLLSMEPLPHQPVAVPLVSRARYGSPWGRGSLSALARTVRRRPRPLVGILRQLVRDTWRRPSFLAKDLLLLPRVCAVAEEVRSLGLQHVHAHFATHAGFAAWAIHRLSGVSFSIVAHGSDVHRHQLMLCTKVAEASFVATVSEYNRQVILGVCGDSVADRVVVIRNGVDLDAVRSASTGARSDGAPLVLCVGTLHEVKGQAHLVDAVAVLRDRGHEVVLELIGDGPDRQALEALVERRGLHDRVRFAGSLPRDEVLRRYADASVLVAPSVESSDGRKEGVPTVVVEAMASGVPVIASRLAGIPEVVVPGETGVLVEPGDVEGIAAALEDLLVEPGRRADQVERARARVTAEFDVVHTSRAMATRIASAADVGRVAC